MAKIMLVEDDNNLREIYGARLMAEGYDIVAAKDGEEALAIAVKEKPDLIISDVMMPKISGFDMLDILRTTPETKNTKVIMMTALSQAEDKARADKLGADRYLVKSQVTLEDVAHVVKEVLESGAPTAAAEPAATTPALPVAEAVAVNVTTSSSSEPTAPEPVAMQLEPINLPAPQPFTATEPAAVPQTPAPAEPVASNEPAAAEPAMAQPPVDQPAPQPFTEAAAAPTEPQPAPQPYVAPAETPAPAPSGPPAANTGIDPNSIAL